MSFWRFVGDQYDWTIGGLYDGNEWRKYRVIPRAHPLRPCVFAYFHWSGSRGAFKLPGATWDRFRCTVEPSGGHIRCRFPQMYSIFRVKIGHVPLERSVFLESRKAHFGGRKGQMVNLGSKTRKHMRFLLNKGEPEKDHTWSSNMDWC